MGWGLCVIQDRQVSVRYVSKMEFCSICELCEKTYTIQNYDYHRRKSKKVKTIKFNGYIILSQNSQINRYNKATET